MKTGIKGGARVGFVLLVVVAAAVWWSLGRLDADVAWLTVEAPGYAVAGEVLPLRVRVTGLKVASRLAVNLHGSSLRDGSNDFLAMGGAKPVGKEGGQFGFEIMVYPRKDLHFVNAILFLSPSGDWKDQTFVATTELIPVTGRHGEEGPAMMRLAVHPLVGKRGQVNAGHKAFPRLIVGLMLLAASVMTLARSQPARNRWLALAAAFALAGVWELLELENRLGAMARAWARAEDVYYPREMFQKVVISLTIAGVMVFVGLAWRKLRHYQPALLFFGLYAGISAINLLSLHSLDVYAGCSWHGITLVDALKFLCVVATLLCVLRARRCPE